MKRLGLKLTYLFSTIAIYPIARYIFLFINVYNAPSSNIQMTISSYIKGVLRESSKIILDEVQENISKRIDNTIIKFQNKIAKKIISLFILLSGFLFLALSFVFVLIEYVGLNKTASFAITGSILLLIGIIFHISN